MKLYRIIHNEKLLRRVGFIVSCLALISGIATYFALTQSNSFADKTRHVLPLIYLDLTLMLILSIFIIHRVIALWVARKKGSAGSKLHIQIAALFGFVAIVPGILLTVFTALFFHMVIQAWFSEPVRQALTEAQAVAEVYLQEHSNAISHDAQELAWRLRPQMSLLAMDTELLEQEINQIVLERGLDEALVFDSQTRVLARGFLTFALEFEKVLYEHFEKAKLEQIIVTSNARGDRVRALVKIDDQTDTYLYIGKMIDPKVLNHVLETRSAINAYTRLDSQHSNIQLTFVVFFSLVAFLLLLVAVWVGLMTANRFVRPITRLIDAANQVGAGNLMVTVLAQGSMNNELGTLATAFNRMVQEIRHQRQDLMKANQQIDQRRQFTEAVLSRISAGVLRCNLQGQIDLMNARAQKLLLPHPHEDLHVRSVLPEIQEFLSIVAVDGEVFQKQIRIIRHGQARVLRFSIVLDSSDEAGYIMTFDDITPLLLAQKKATWADVARKIAHEIKNPLTPIQLSAERLRRKYRHEIQTDPEIFITCIDTIVRQVGQIGKLVSEFSKFARMPEPNVKKECLNDLCHQAISLQKQAYTNIHFTLSFSHDSIQVECDALQISQILTNALQNAINALTSDSSTDDQPSRPFPQIAVCVDVKDGVGILTVEDNGPGFPVEERERLTEPYYTTHAKGSGLGLAIAAKIIDDHRWKMTLSDSDALGGAKVMIEFPVITKDISHHGE